MQVKVVIGTIAFMLAMIIFGFATLLEPGRLQETTEAFEGRQIENGATLFKNNCAECHGAVGRAESCFDTAGNSKACVGRPLNNVDLLCGEPSTRMVQLNWAGSKRNLILQTIAAGRPGTVMPTWSGEFGGPMGDHQVEQLTSFVMNWEADPALCGEETVVVEAVEWPASVANLPAGDAASGQTLYTSYGCNACHGDPTAPGSNAIGPWLADIGNLSSERVAGQSSAEYLYESILNPSAFIAPICARDQPCGDPSVMEASNFDLAITSVEDMADLLAYLGGLTAE